EVATSAVDKCIVWKSLVVRRKWKMKTGSELDQVVVREEKVMPQVSLNAMNGVNSYQTERLLQPIINLIKSF
ncbi:hypothetical protein Tco_0147871, partial [Tanacetum coccineum]